MPHAIIRGANGRRHQVDLATSPVRVEIYSSEETIEIFIEVDFEKLPEERRRFALLNIPRHRLCHGNANERTLRAKLGNRHAAATAPCHCVVASARKIRSAGREMRWR